MTTPLLMLVLAMRVGEAELIIPGSEPAPSYRPFVSPLPIWEWWPITLIPLCLAVAIVYKAIKSESMRELPRRSLLITLWIVGGMGAAALVLALIVKIL